MGNVFGKFMLEADKLLETAKTMFPDGLLKDGADCSGSGFNAGAWERYRKIVCGFMAAKGTCSGWTGIKFVEEPDDFEDFATVTVKLQKACTFSDEGKTALALGAMLADMVTTTTDGDRVWVNFTVRGIWA